MADGLSCFYQDYVDRIVLNGYFRTDGADSDPIHHP
jgi:hypothetical protein